MAEVESLHAVRERVLPQLNRIEMHQVNYFLGVMLALLSLYPVAFLDSGVFLHYFFALAVVGAGALFPRWRLVIPVELWRVIPLLIVLGFLVDLVVFAGIAGFLDALIRLNILLVCHRAVAFRKRREDPQLILLCLFLVIVVAVKIVSVFFVLQIMAFAAIAMGLLFNGNLLGNAEHEEEPIDIWDGFSWGHFLMRLRECADLRLFGLAGVLFVAILSLSAGIFLLIPRLNLENSIGFFGLRDSTSVSRFTEEVGLRDITDIMTDHRTALRIDPPSRHAIPSDPYWRMVVLDEYSVNRYGEGRFRISRALSRTTRRINSNRFSPNDLDWEANERGMGPRGEWLFYLEGGVAQWLPLAGDFGSLRIRGTSQFNNVIPFRILSQSGVNAQLFFYQVSGMAFQDRFFDPYMSIEDWPMVSPDSPPIPGMVAVETGEYFSYRSSVLQLPQQRRDREYLLEVAAEISGGETLPAEEFVNRAIRYLWDRHEYSLSSSLPPERGDPIVRWLRNEVDGHCEYFAGALIMLSRAAGYPARMVTGFHGGTWNHYENYLMVRFSDAHAWCEIYDGNGYWFRADPTPSGGDELLDGMDGSDSFLGVRIDASWLAFLDSLRVQWYRRVVSFDGTAQTTMAEAIRERMRILREGTEQGFANIGRSVRDWFHGPWDGPRWITLATILLAVTTVVFFGRRMGWRVVPYIVPQRARNTLDPVRRQAGILLRRLERGIADNDGGFSVPEPELASVRHDLRVLRFGHPENRRAPGKVFVRTRILLKRLR